MRPQAPEAPEIDVTMVIGLEDAYKFVHVEIAVGNDGGSPLVDVVIEQQAILLGENLDSSAQIGGAMILAGCLANTIIPEGFMVDAAAGAEGGGGEADGGDADSRMM